MGYCTTATWRVSCESSRTERPTTSSRSTAPSRKVAIARRSRRAHRLDRGQAVDEEAVALVGRHPAGAGVRLGDEPLLLQRRHVVAHRRGRDAETVPLDERLGADRLLGGHVVLHDRAEHGEPALLLHPASSRPVPTLGTPVTWHSNVLSAKTTSARPGMTGFTGAGFREVADRVWVARYEWFDVNITLVGGERGLLVVDTHGSAGAAREVVDDVRRLGAGEVTGDRQHALALRPHLRQPHLPRGLRRAADPRPRERARRARGVGRGAQAAACADAPDDDPHHEDVLGDRDRAARPDVLLGEGARPRRPGGRARPPRPRPHLRRPRGPRARRRRGARRRPRRGVGPRRRSTTTPGRWTGRSASTSCWACSRPATVVVPGHGAPVGPGRSSRSSATTIGIVAETIRDLASRGVPVDQALEAGEWPWPREHLATAVRRGYEHLPRSQKRLPLI